jgi:hypothetical protein
VTVGSPAYFKSCGASPIETKGKTCVSSANRRVAVYVAMRFEAHARA